MFGSLQGTVVFAISLAVMVGSIWALADALRYPPATFVAAGKQTKAVWGVLLGVVTAVTFVLLPAPLGSGRGVLGILGVACIIVVVYYLVDVSKALRDNNRGPRAGGW